MNGEGMGKVQFEKGPMSHEWLLSAELYNGKLDDCNNVFAKITQNI